MRVSTGALARVNLVRSVRPFHPVLVAGTYVPDYWLVIFLISVYVCVS